MSEIFIVEFCSFRFKLKISVRFIIIPLSTKIKLELVKCQIGSSETKQFMTHSDSWDKLIRMR